MPDTRRDNGRNSEQAVFNPSRLSLAVPFDGGTRHARLGWRELFHFAVDSVNDNRGDAEALVAPLAYPVSPTQDSAIQFEGGVTTVPLPIHCDGLHPIALKCTALQCETTGRGEMLITETRNAGILLNVNSRSRLPGFARRPRHSSPPRTLPSERPTHVHEVVGSWPQVMAIRSMMAIS